MSRKYSKEIANNIKSFLEGDNWHFSFDEEKGVFKFGLNIRNKMKKIDYLIVVEEDEFTVYGIAPICADNEDKKAMTNITEFLSRVNYGLRRGCFEIDPDDGEIRYRNYVDCDEQLPSKAVIKNSIYGILYRYRRYASGILEIIFMGTDPKEAVQKCEQSENAQLRNMLAEMGEESDGDVEGLLERLSQRLVSSGEEATEEEEAEGSTEE